MWQGNGSRKYLGVGRMIRKHGTHLPRIAQAVITFHHSLITAWYLCLVPDYTAW